MAIVAIPLIIGGLSLQTRTNLYAGPYYYFFGLSPDSTVEQFRAAPENLKAHWLKTMCNGGVCLLNVDWLCGFSISSDIHNEADQGWQTFNANVDACFMSLAYKAPLEDKLSKIRIICGRRYMIFSGSTEDTTPAICTRAGGEWGKIEPAFEDEEKYVE